MTRRGFLEALAAAIGGAATAAAAPALVKDALMPRIQLPGENSRIPWIFWSASDEQIRIPRNYLVQSVSCYLDPNLSIEETERFLEAAIVRFSLNGRALVEGPVWLAMAPTRTISPGVLVPAGSTIGFSCVNSPIAPYPRLSQNRPVGPLLMMVDGILEAFPS